MESTLALPEAISLELNQQNWSFLARRYDLNSCKLVRKERTRESKAERENGCAALSASTASQAARPPASQKQHLHPSLPSQHPHFPRAVPGSV